MITDTTLAAAGGGERVNFGFSSDLCGNRVVIWLSRACRRSGRVPPTPGMLRCSIIL